MNEWLAGRESVSPEEFGFLREHLGISEAYLRKLLREAPGLSLHPLVEGVRQESFASLERTLLAMKDEPAYRAVVREARTHARLALRSPSVDRAAKEEMIVWLRMWLEAPGVFPAWLALRKRALEKMGPGISFSRY